jgi:hypothetical protein
MEYLRMEMEQYEMMTFSGRKDRNKASIGKQTA